MYTFKLKISYVKKIYLPSEVDVIQIIFFSSDSTQVLFMNSCFYIGYKYDF